MKKNNRLQVQAVLYRNAPESLTKALDMLANALRRDRQRDGYLGEVRMVWGDASPSPVFTEEQIQAIAQKYQSDFTLQYIYFNENTGYGEGHNRLAKDQDTDFLMIQNPDILIMGDYFHFMMLPFENNSTGLTEARQTPVEHPKKYDPQTLETPWASGACFVIPTPLYQMLGGFDTQSFFMYSEDVDLSLRIRLEGKKLIYQPAAPVYHSKHLTENAHLKVTATELRYSPEAQLALAYKWNNQSLLNRLLAAFEGGDKIQREAAAAFHQRVKEKKIKPIRKRNHLYQEKDFENRFVL